MTPTQILAVRAAASPPPSGSAAGQVVAQGSTPVERPDPRQLRCTLASPGAGALRAQAVHAHPGRSRADHGTRAAGSGPNAARNRACGWHRHRSTPNDQPSTPQTANGDGSRSGGAAVGHAGWSPARTVDRLVLNIVQPGSAVLAARPSVPRCGSAGRGPAAITADNPVLCPTDGPRVGLRQQGSVKRRGTRRAVRVSHGSPPRAGY